MQLVSDLLLWSEPPSELFVNYIKKEISDLFLWSEPLAELFVNYIKKEIIDIYVFAGVWHVDWCR